MSQNAMAIIPDENAKIWAGVSMQSPKRSRIHDMPSGQGSLAFGIDVDDVHDEKVVSLKYSSVVIDDVSVDGDKVVNGVV